MTLTANGQSWEAEDDWDEDTVPDRRLPTEHEEDELYALFIRFQ